MRAVSRGTTAGCAISATRMSSTRRPWLRPAVGGGSRLPSYVSSCTSPAAAGGACASRGSGSACRSAEI